MFCGRFVVLNENTKNPYVQTRDYGTGLPSAKLLMGHTVNEQTNHRLVARGCCGLECVAVLAALGIGIGTTAHKQTGNRLVAVVRRRLECAAVLAALGVDIGPAVHK